MVKKKLVLIYGALIIAAILFALGPNLIKLMVTMGGTFGLQYPEAISFCNVLFVGNLCAAIVTGTIYGYKSILLEFWHLSKKTKFYLLIASCLFAISPSLIFIALEYTTVVNVVIITRLNSIIYLVIGLFILKAPLHWQEIVGYMVIVISIIIMLYLNNQGFILSKGDFLVLISTFFSAITDIFNGKVLQDCSAKTYTFFRNLISAIIFFFIVLLFFGPGHFMDVFRGELWILMVLYASLAITLPQILWFFSFNKLPISVIGNISLINPIFQFTFAYLLLREIPNALQFVCASGEYV